MSFNIYFKDFSQKENYGSGSNLKFMVSKKATKNYKIFTVDMTLTK